MAFGGLQSGRPAVAGRRRRPASATAGRRGPASPATGPGRRASGFTLPELLATIAVLGILCVIAVPSLGTGGGAQRMDQEVERLRVALLDARARAIAEDADHRFVLEGGGAYRVEASDPGGWALRRSHRLPPAFRLTVDGASSGTITFLARGAVDAPRTLLVRGGGDTRRLRVLPGGLVHEPGRAR